MAALPGPPKMEEIVKMVRLSLHNKEPFLGHHAIFWEREDMPAQPLPLLRTINCILSRYV
jgi:hypothetical protein